MALKRHHKWMIGSFTTLIIIYMITTGILLNAIIARQNLNYNTLNSKITNLQLETRMKFNTIASSLRELEKSVSSTKKGLTKVEEKLQESQMELSKLKATNAKDFSGIIENSIPSVVTIVTDVSQGTGFVISEGGYIVTNAHVIQGAEKAGIYTYDGKIHQVRLIGIDEFMDVCLLKIEEEYPPLSLGDSDKISIGEPVIAIGNPLGLQFSVTEGIISAIHRPGINGVKAYIQTDAALNPGNSGGPLINKEGKVIGINNFKTIGGENLGFALESNYLKKTINQIAQQYLNQTILE